MKLLFCWVAFALLAWLAQSEEQDTSATIVMLRQHIINYTTLAPSRIPSSSISQHFLDMNGREVVTAFSVDAGLGETIRMQAVRVDFMVGRRTAGTTTAMNFAWDAPKNLSASLIIELRIYRDCTCAGISCPCATPVSSIVIDGFNNASSIYTLRNLVWGSVFRADLLLRKAPSVTNSSSGGEYLCTPPDTLPAYCARHWLALVGHLPGQNRSWGFDYTFRLPVANDNANETDLRLYDPTHLINATWTTWQSGKSIGAAYYDNLSNPQVGIEVAGQRYLQNTTTTTTTTTTSPSSPLPSPVVSTPMVSPPAVWKSPSYSSSPAPIMDSSTPKSDNVSGFFGTPSIKPHFYEDPLIMGLAIGILVVVLVLISLLICIGLLARRSKRKDNQKPVNGQYGQALIVSLDENDVTADGATYVAANYDQRNPGALHFDNSASLSSNSPRPAAKQTESPDFFNRFVHWLNSLGKKGDNDDDFTVMIPLTEVKPPSPRVQVSPLTSSSKKNDHDDSGSFD